MKVNVKPWRILPQTPGIRMVRILLKPGFDFCIVRTKKLFLPSWDTRFLAAYGQRVVAAGAHLFAQLCQRRRVARRPLNRRGLVLVAVIGERVRVVVTFSGTVVQRMSAHGAAV